MRKGLLCGHVKPLVAARSNSTFLPSGGVLLGRKLQGRDWERRCGGTLGSCKRATPWSQPRVPSHRGVICYRSDAFCQGSTTDPARPKASTVSEPVCYSTVEGATERRRDRWLAHHTFSDSLRR